MSSPRGLLLRHDPASAQFSFQYPSDPLPYNGGPVLHTNETYAIFWGAPDDFPTGYQDLVTRYLTDVAADSGTNTNVYSVLNQYTDSNGPITYSSVYAGSSVDTDPYPAGCDPNANPGAIPYSACITDQNVADEIDSFVSAHDIARPSNRGFMIFLPPGVQECFGGSAPSYYCSGVIYCAHHDYFTTTAGDNTLFAVMPYDAFRGCDTPSHPNGNPADAVINTLSHEHREMINDPYGNAWFDQFGNEGSDKCAWYFGPSKNNGVGDYNQVINGHDYLIQAEWSNSLAQAQNIGCVTNGADHAPTARLSVKVSGSTAAFDATATSDPDAGDALTYFWNYGDGTPESAAGSTTRHSYQYAGTYNALLIVTDSAGAESYSGTTVTVTSGRAAASSNPFVTAGFGGQAQTATGELGHNQWSVSAQLTSHGATGHVSRTWSAPGGAPLRTDRFDVVCVSIVGNDAAIGLVPTPGYTNSTTTGPAVLAVHAGDSSAPTDSPWHGKYALFFGGSVPVDPTSCPLYLGGSFYSIRSGSISINH